MISDIQHRLSTIRAKQLSQFRHLTHNGPMAGALEMPGTIVLKELKRSGLTMGYVNLSSRP